MTAGGPVAGTQDPSARTTIARSPAVVEIREPRRPARRLTVTGLIVIGRGPDGYFVLDQQVSRRHVELTFRAGVLSATDLGSRHGTRLNGKLLTRTASLQAGDVLWVGHTEIVVLAVPTPDLSLTTTRARGSLRSARVEPPSARYVVELRLPGAAAGRRLVIDGVTDLGRQNVAVVVDAGGGVWAGAGSGRSW
jgi:pSer/pThr/pTyr-binding forkhead associated (FHA) protein